MMLNYKEQYILLCSQLMGSIDESTTDEDIQNHNNTMKKLGDLYHQVENISDKSFFLVLLEHSDVQTRMLAAAHCLGLNIYLSEAKSVLKKIAKFKDDPQVAFEAQAILDVWKEQGYLKF